MSGRDKRAHEKTSDAAADLHVDVMSVADLPRLPDASLRLGDLLRQRRVDIMAAWEAIVCKMPVAKALDRPTLVDHIPELLDRIADLADHIGSGKSTQLPKALSEMHAVERLSEGSTSDRLPSSSAC